MSEVSPTMHAILCHRVLSRDKEIELLTKYARRRERFGANHERTLRTRNCIVRRNMKLVRTIGHEYHGLDDDEKLNEGATGLMRAIETYDVTYGYRFSTYACHWIRHHIRRAIENTSRLVRIPVRKQHGEMKMTLEPTVIGFAAPVSFDAPLATDEDAGTRYDVTPSDAESQEALLSEELRRKKIQDALQTLSEGRERDVIVRRYGLDGGEVETLQEIGERHGLSRERIRQVQVEAIAKLRRALPGGSAAFL